MLARLDELTPGHWAVNREGTLLRLVAIQGQEEQIRDRVIEAISEMGFIAEETTDTVDDVSRWYSSAEIGELTAEEARVLADRWVHELLDEGSPELSEDRLRTALEEMLTSAFLKAAETGVVRVDPEDFQYEGKDPIITKELDQVRDWLTRKLRGGGHLPAE